MHEAIGGYFELETPKKVRSLHLHATHLNSGRSCIGYIVDAYELNRIYISRYTCNVVMEPLISRGVEIQFYETNYNLEIVDLPKLSTGMALIYVNYFGLKNDYCKSLISKLGDRLILDYSQAYFSEPSRTSPTFYSPRKFFGLPDGGLVYSSKESSVEYDRCVHSHLRSSHLLKRFELGPEAGYNDLTINDSSVGEATELMSNLTRSLLDGVDDKRAQSIRSKNAKKLHESLRQKSPWYSSGDSPLCYPVISEVRGLREHLIANRVYVPLYWPNVLECLPDDHPEARLAERIIPLPIDHRYNSDDMERVARLVNDYD